MSSVSAGRSANSHTKLWLTRYTQRHGSELTFSWWLTVKYCMISGLLLDFSSTSVNTSSTSEADGKIHSISHYRRKLFMLGWNRRSSMVLTLHCFSLWHLLQVHGHICSAQCKRSRYVDQGQRAGRQVICNVSRKISQEWEAKKSWAGNVSNA